VASVLRSVGRAVSSIGALPGDDEELRLKKAFLVTFSLVIIPSGVVWGAIYWAFGEPVAASIPLGYTILSACSILVFAALRSYPFLRFVQFALILIAPFLLMLALGGFVPSSAVILWSFVCPMGAIVFDAWRRAWWWFAAYVGLVVLGAFIAPSIRPTNNLPGWLILAFFALNIATVSLVAFGLLASFARQREAALRLVRVEQQRAESLLLNILPRSIAEILKTETRTIADRFDSASILFADVVDFTPLSSRLPPEDVVGILDELFRHFDTLADAHGLEKIKTIGDSYMVAAGVPEPRPDHARAIALLALEMRDSVVRHPGLGVHPVELRIGINSGPVVAGVIGRKRLTYDLWGDTVNVASRMESQGTAGRIQVTEATFDLLQHEFVLEHRGSIPVKGRGHMQTWYLIGPRPVTAGG
jgi:guanylate cyclase